MSASMSPQFSRSEYVFGGYLLTQRVARRDSMAPDLLPACFVTVSSCIGTFVPDAWAYDWVKPVGEEREEAALVLGIEPHLLPKLIQEVTTLFDEKKLGWPRTIKSLQTANQLLRLLPSLREWLVLGLALHKKYQPLFLAEEAPQKSVSPGGIYEMLSEDTVLPAGGEMVGFELLGFEGGLSHSWLCNGLEKECFEALAIRPNSSGLIRNSEEADLANEHISKEEVGAEPVQWLPWMILKYSSS